MKKQRAVSWTLSGDVHVKAVGKLICRRLCRPGYGVVCLGRSKGGGDELSLPPAHCVAPICRQRPFFGCLTGRGCGEYDECVALGIDRCLPRM